MNDDTISRQAAIDALSAILDNPNHAEFLYGDEICKTLQDLPSAERLGTWTTKRTMYHDGETYCDQCGWTWEDITHGRISVTRTPFCPNCGAKMRMTRE